MEPLNLRFIAKNCRAKLNGSYATNVVESICTDTRRLKNGSLFLALEGDRFDAHRFVDRAVQDGAGAVVVHDQKLHERATWPSLLVNDTREALRDLAGAYRCMFDLPVCAVAGSNGKTTTKDMIAAALSQGFPTLKSEASFNNEVGVPLTLLKLEKCHQAAVLEVGTNHPGELQPLLELVRPKFGVITSIGSEHLEHFHDSAGVAKEEGTLAETLPKDGTLWIPGDSEWAPQLRERAKCKVVSVGFDAGNDWVVRVDAVNANGTSFTLTRPEEDAPRQFKIRLPGRHHALNAAYAVAVATRYGVSADAIAAGLSECVPSALRMESRRINGIQYLLDCYNANGDSMVAAIQTLAELKCSGRRIAVLGEMAELGDLADREHKRVGVAVESSGIDAVYTIGPRSRAISANLARSLTKHFEDISSLTEFLKTELSVGDLVLMKASRSVALERVFETLSRPTS